MLNVSLKDEDLGLQSTLIKNYSIRVASRGIVIKDNRIAIFCKKEKNEYKLPGGGVEDNESLEEAFKREVLEETGCEVSIVKKLGVVREYRTRDSFLQISHVFLSNVTNDTMKLNLTEKEITEGGELIWCNPKEGLTLIIDAYPSLKGSNFESLYHTQFISKRDQLILKYYIDENK